MIQCSRLFAFHSVLPSRTVSVEFHAKSKLAAVFIGSNGLQHLCPSLLEQRSVINSVFLY